MPTARELLQQADAMMRRNRGAPPAPPDVPGVQVGPETVRERDAGPPTPGEPMAGDGAVPVAAAVRAAEDPEFFVGAIADEPVAPRASAPIEPDDDIPELTDVVEEIQAAALPLAEADARIMPQKASYDVDELGVPDDWLHSDLAALPRDDHEPSIAPLMNDAASPEEVGVLYVAPDLLPPIPEATASRLPPAEADWSAGGREDAILGEDMLPATLDTTLDGDVGPVDGDAAEVIVEPVGSIEDLPVPPATSVAPAAVPVAEAANEAPLAAAPEPEAVVPEPAAAAPEAAEAVASEPAVAVASLPVAAGTAAAVVAAAATSGMVAADAATSIASPVAAQGLAPALADDARWAEAADEIRMQVLQRIDIYTDTGLREQLATRLQPIVDRASADLVSTINQQVGQLLRAYVAEAIEREIEQWRSRNRP